MAVYSNYLLNKYGEEEFKKLDQRHWLAMKGEYRTDEDYQNIIHKYDKSVS